MSLTHMCDTPCNYQIVVDFFENSGLACQSTSYYPPYSEDARIDYGPS